MAFCPLGQSLASSAAVVLRVLSIMHCEKVTVHHILLFIILSCDDVWLTHYYQNTL